MGDYTVIGYRVTFTSEPYYRLSREFRGGISRPYEKHCLYQRDNDHTVCSNIMCSAEIRCTARYDEKVRLGLPLHPLIGFRENILLTSALLMYMESKAYYRPYWGLDRKWIG